jgi:hypothetical protein
MQDIQAVETVINVRYPKDCRLAKHQGMVSDFQRLVDSSQMGHHFKRYRFPDGNVVSDIVNRFLNTQESVTIPFILLAAQKR